MKIKYCPKCKSSNVTLDAGFITAIYVCKDCGYKGKLVIEKEVEE